MIVPKLLPPVTRRSTLHTPKLFCIDFGIQGFFGFGTGTQKFVKGTAGDFIVLFTICAPILHDDYLFVYLFIFNFLIF